MIIELLKHITTSTPEYVKKMGYLREVIAIEHRFKRCKKEWKEHLELSKQTILDSLSLCIHNKRVVILGSGFLLDLPLRELSNTFEEVVLVDILHMPSVREAVSIFSNVVLITSDITGLAEKLYISRPKPEGSLPQSEPFLPYCDDDCSLVISLNILSQLPIIPSHYLMNDLKWKESEKLLCWSNQIMLDHYKALNHLKIPVCLISDYEMVYIDKKGNEIDRQITVPFLAKAKPYNQWRWNIAPIGIESRKYAVELIVSAFLLEKDKKTVR